MYDDGSSSPLLRQLPQIRRARDYRLYTGDGRRLTDLWQYGGQSLLGHTVPHQLLEMKNNASRGLFVPFPNQFEGRLEKAFHLLFPGRVIRIYKNRESMQEAFSQANFECPMEHFLPDPALGQTTAHNTLSLWRPFLGDAENTCTQADILMPVLPFSWMNGPRVLLIEKVVSKNFPPSDLLSSVISSSLLASIYALMKQNSSEKADYSTLIHDLSKTSWQPRGIYLTNPYFKDDSFYKEIFCRFLQEGFLIPPKRNLPLILPVKPNALSVGETAKLMLLLTECGN
jgi:hypothetical protein